MRIAILGATSQIAKDLIESFAVQDQHNLVLYARRPRAVQEWLARVNLVNRYAVHDFEAFVANEHFDAILNFVGVGNPAHASAMGASIFDVTLKYDGMALDYMRQHPKCRYIFLSSGAAYGASFDSPVEVNTCANVPINNLQPQDWYGVAKLHAECRHRALAHLPIVDIRVFNYFSHTQDMDARFFITDIVRSIRDNTVLHTSSEFMFRDYIHPLDFYGLVTTILHAPTSNAVVDAYSRAPVNKLTLLALMQEQFGLQYVTLQSGPHINATGNKSNYFSLNKSAAALDYQPCFTSIESLLIEFKKLEFLQKVRST
jgi:nucleoside-diphosphate-sugar epimerase